MAKKIEAVEVQKKSESSNQKATPQKDKGLMTFVKNNFLLIAAIIYLLIPIDFLPDVVPILGYGDDVVLLAAGLLRSYVKYKQGKE
ncbi:MAG: YkvA family protein [Candidatus Dojkabacteria bacterium]|nr:MAG: YkvA family protein [Candidatus Dojkabacteria bacterium]